MTENVILVDADDNEVGSMQKMEAHVAGVLHRAFSVFIFNSKGELLLQQRAEEKYHSGGKWTNTCCSHPRTGEKTISAAHRRLKEEMGMDCELNYAFNFTYRADVMNGLYENEYDHVYFGRCDDQPIPNPSEVASFRYIDLESLEEELKTNHSQFTEWLKICFDEVKEHFFKLL